VSKNDQLKNELSEEFAPMLEKIRALESKMNAEGEAGDGGILVAPGGKLL
jgi:hypothetical protein